MDELVQLVTRRGERDSGNIDWSIPSSKMCISVLRSCSVQPSADVVRKGVVRQGVEAVYIAGPEGGFQGWQVRRYCVVSCVWKSAYEILSVLRVRFPTQGRGISRCYGLDSQD